MTVEYLTVPQKNKKCSEEYQSQLEEAPLANWESKTNEIQWDPWVLLKQIVGLEFDEELEWKDAKISSYKVIN